MFKCFVAGSFGARRRAGAAFHQGAVRGYQVEVLFYVPADLGGPHNLGEEYRRNTPVMYYTMTRLWDYSGRTGSAAVEAAFAILNSVTNVSSFSSDLSEWRRKRKRYNFRAQALNSPT